MRQPAPVIEALKPFKKHFSAEYILNLPSDTPFGNLTLGWMEIVVRFECVNALIEKLYEEFYLLKTQFEETHLCNPDQLYRQKFYSEQTIYWFFMLPM